MLEKKDAPTSDGSPGSRLLLPIALLAVAGTITLVLRLSRPPDGMMTRELSPRPAPRRSSQKADRIARKSLTPPKITLQQIRFEPRPEIVMIPLPYPFGLAYAKGKLLIRDRIRQKVVWKGPVFEARFVQNPEQQAQVVTHSAGQRRWAPLPSFSRPDVVIRKEVDRRTVIQDRAGNVLWSGTLPQAAPTLSVRAPGKISLGDVTLQGGKESGGIYTISNNADEKLWSGKLPKDPLVYLQTRDTFQYSWHTGAGSGVNLSADLRFAAEKGEVTITDPQNHPIGKRPVTLIRVIESNPTKIEPGKGSKSSLLGDLYCADGPRLTTNGAVFLTYRDSTGQVFLQTQAFRNDRASGETGRGQMQ